MSTTKELSDDTKMYMKLLQGKYDNIRPYKNSNLLLLGKYKTYMERSKNDIGPPQNLNPRLVEEDRIKSLKKLQQTSNVQKSNKQSSISKRLLKLLEDE